MIEYIYTFSKNGELESISEYHGEKVGENQTFVKLPDGLFNPTFNKKTNEWQNGKIEPTKPPTPDEVLAEKVEETKHKTITEFELRKILSEQQAKTMRMIMMLAKK